MSQSNQYQSRHSGKDQAHASRNEPTEYSVAQSSSEHLERFFRDLRNGDTPGSKPEHKQWQEYHYRLLNTLGYLNVSASEAGVLERTADAGRTAQASIKKVITATVDSVSNVAGF